MIDYKVTTTTRVVIDYNQASRAPTRPPTTPLATLELSTGHGVGVGDFLFVPTLTWIAHVKLYGVHYVKYTVQYIKYRKIELHRYTHTRVRREWCGRYLKIVNPVL